MYSNNLQGVSPIVLFHPCTYIGTLDFGAQQHLFACQGTFVGHKVHLLSALIYHQYRNTSRVQSGICAKVVTFCSVHLQTTLSRYMYAHVLCLHVHIVHLLNKQRYMYI